MSLFDNRERCEFTVAVEGFGSPSATHAPARIADRAGDIFQPCRKDVEVPTRALAEDFALPGLRFAGGYSRRMRGPFVSLAAYAMAFSAAIAADVPPKKNASAVSPATSKAKPDWTIDLGAGGVFSPKFFGSKDFKISPIPYAAINYRAIIFASVDKGLGANLLDTNGFKAGPILGYRGGRKESDSRQYLHGLGDVDPTLTAGGFIKYDYGHFLSTELKVEKGVVSFGSGQNKTLASLGIIEKSKGNLGTKVEWSADAHLPPLFDNRLLISAGPRVSFFDQEYAKAEYGVTFNQSLASGYRAFKPKAGIGEVGVGASALYRVTDNITAAAFGGYTRIVGDAAKSPIVLGPGGSKDQFKVGAGLIYRFGL